MSKEIINAFHPDFVKTYMPDMLKEQINSTQKSEAKSKHIAQARKTIPNYGSMVGAFSKKKPRVEQIGKTVAGRKMSMIEAHNAMVDEIAIKKLSTKQRVDLAPKEFKIYSQAGGKNVSVKKGKK